MVTAQTKRNKMEIYNDILIVIEPGPTLVTHFRLDNQNIDLGPKFVSITVHKPS